MHERTVRRAIERGVIAATKRGGTYQITPAALARFRPRRRRTSPAVTRDRDAAPSLASTLPTSLTPLIGREREVAAVCTLLRHEDAHAGGSSGARLVTLTGPGGVGKTRLALEVAAAVGAEYAGGAFVPLAPVRDLGLVAATIAKVLGVRESADRPLVEALKGALGDSHFFLVLDNFEHVVEAAALLPQLLAACPRLTMLVTSRARLRVSGERDVAVPPLALPACDERDGQRLPSVEVISGAAAVRLFVDRAQAVDVDFRLTDDNAPAVAEVCRRLDGLPLAIELAAARSKVLSPSALLARLDRRLPVLSGGPRDAPARLQTMVDAIAWSYNLLSEEERVLFRRLSVFVGGFTLDAAEAVAGPSDLGPGNPVFDGVVALVDHHLLGRTERPDGGNDADPRRFGMLETIREYGLLRLDAAGESTEVSRRHAEWCLAFAEEATTRFFTANEAAAVAKLEAEYGNLRAALTWTSECGDAETSLRLAAALGRFWYIQGHLREGQGWLERALALDLCATTAPAARAWALSWLEHMTAYQGDFELSAARLEEALAIFRTLGDRSGEARVLFQIGGLAEFQGDDEGARPQYEQALALYRELGDLSRVALALENLGDADYRRGAYQTAAALADEALTTSRAGGDVLIVTQSLVGVAQVASITGDHDRAAVALKECLGLTVAVGHRIGIADALAGCAGLAAATGRPAVGARLLGATAALCAEIGAARVFHVDQHRWALASAQAALEPAAFATAWKAGRALTAPLVVAEALEALDGVLAPPGAAAGTPVSEATRTLSPRELEVLGLLVEGRSDPEIAGALFIGHRTASKHVSAILAKLGVRSRAAAAAHAVRHGLV